MHDMAVNQTPPRRASSTLRFLPVAALLVGLVLPLPAHADSILEVLHSVAAANCRQPGLQHYLVSVKSPQIEELINATSVEIPTLPKPPPPTLTRFWQSNGPGFVFASMPQPRPIGETITEPLAALVAIEPGLMLIPAAGAKRRADLLKDADIKQSEVVLADNLTRHLEIVFNKPTDLEEAFYARSTQLPQSGVLALALDIDTRTSRISELTLTAEGRPRLTVEIRYYERDDCHVPERISTTSPDGLVDELIEIRYQPINEFVLPVSVRRFIRHQDYQEQLEIFYKDYRINQPVPADIQARLDSHQQE